MYPISQSLTLRLFLPLLLSATVSAAEGTLFVCGGGDLPERLMTQFVTAAGGHNAKLVIIPTAASDDAMPDQQQIAARWQARGIGHASVLHTRDRDRANDPAFVAPLQQATAVWMSGGQQSRLGAVYVETKVEEELNNLLSRGGVVGGTSAGAAIQSRVMIVGGKQTPKMGDGMDLVPHAIVDQHFLRRNRQDRLHHAVRLHPARMGVGIDESTALIVQGTRATVVGESEVIVTVQHGDRQQTRRFRDGQQFVLQRTNEAASKWALVVHGGAGRVDKERLDSHGPAYRAGLTRAARAGKRILENGGTSLDAVEATIAILEDDPLFNAGVGAVFNSSGKHELDASIMDGQTLDGGGVAGVRTVKHPIQLARLVMDQTRHVLLAGDGAESFATEQLVERVKNEVFSTEYRRRQWKRAVQAAQANKSAWNAGSPRYLGTVGCVALDQHGNLAAGTSTGGLTNKKYGRVGDSPLLGAGTYADNATCGVSGTGIGEQFIRHAVAAQISLVMKHRDWPLTKAAKYVIHERLNEGDGGVVGIDAQGQIVWEFNTQGMFRAAADASGRLEVKVGAER